MKHFMSPGVAGLLMCLLSVVAFAQSTAAQRPQAYRREAYIWSTEPRRSNGEPRRDNITDEEVREVQSAALEIYPDAIVNISTVTEGCECEEGGNCSAQVWLVLFRPGRARGLMLSKIGGHWQVGAVQKWWLRFYDHRDQFPGWASGAEGRAKLDAWRIEDTELLNNFPVCNKPAPSDGRHQAAVNSP